MRWSHPDAYVRTTKAVYECCEAVRFGAHWHIAYRVMEKGRWTVVTDKIHHVSVLVVRRRTH